ncbi:hypothetical protein [Croceimicrobium sp.]|uniref:hypothetical protein n=1 Tax=Croceimicrobium sp. TaxID=2828340 RepID=UPI003BAAAED1
MKFEDIKKGQRLKVSVRLSSGIYKFMPATVQYKLENWWWARMDHNNELESIMPHRMQNVCELDK